MATARSSGGRSPGYGSGAVSARQAGNRGSGGTSSTTYLGSGGTQTYSNTRGVVGGGTTTVRDSSGNVVSVSVGQYKESGGVTAPTKSSVTPLISPQGGKYFVSQDKSSPYYGKVVYQGSTGKLALASTDVQGKIGAAGIATGLAYKGSPLSNLSGIGTASAYLKGERVNQYSGTVIQRNNLLAGELTSKTLKAKETATTDVFSAKSNIFGEIRNAPMQNFIPNYKEQKQGAVSGFFAKSSDVVSSAFPFSFWVGKNTGKSGSVSPSEFRSDYFRYQEPVKYQTKAMSYSVSIPKDPITAFARTFKETQKLRKSSDVLGSQKSIDALRIEGFAGKMRTLNTKTELESKKITTREFSDLNTGKNRFIIEQGVGVQEKYTSEYSKLVSDISKQGITVSKQGDKLSFSSKALGTSDVSIFTKEFKENKLAGKSNVGLVGAFAGTQVLEAGAVGLGLTKIGVTAGISSGARYLWGTGGKVGKGVVIAGTALGLSAPIGGGFKGYSEFKTSGLNPWTGAFIVGGTETAKLGSFMLGASEGKLSPIKYSSYGGEGKYKIRQVYLENPFSSNQKSFTLLSQTNKKVYLGEVNQELSFRNFGIKAGLDTSYNTKLGIQQVNTVYEGSFAPMDKVQASTVNRFVSASREGRLFTEDLIRGKTLELTSGLRNVKIKEVSEIPFEKGRAFNLAPKESQLSFKLSLLEEADYQTKFSLKGFGRAITNKGLEKLYGSSTITSEGGFKTNVMRKNGEFGDFDLSFKDAGAPYAEKYFSRFESLNKGSFRLQKGTSLIEVKNPKTGEFVHFADIHGSDTPDLMLVGDVWGYKPQSPKPYLLTGKQQILGAKLGESLQNKGGSILTLRANPKGQPYFAPESHRIKDVADFVSIAERLNTVQGTDKFTGTIGQTKSLLKVAYGKEVEFGKSPSLFFGGISKSAPSVSSYVLAKGFSTKSFVPSGFIKKQSSLPIRSPSAFLPSYNNPFSKSPSISSYASYKSPSVSQSFSPSSSFSKSMSPSPSKSKSPFSISPSPPSPIIPSPSIPSPSRSESLYIPSPSPSFSSSTYSYNFNYSFTPSSPVRFPIGGGMPDVWGKGKKTKKIRFKTKYNPSVKAGIFGIRGKAPSRFMVASGLGVRPITTKFASGSIARSFKF